jgi:hypothetical protein
MYTYQCTMLWSLGSYGSTKFGYAKFDTDMRYFGMTIGHFSIE